ncbi:hypothetical protein JE939_002818 [Yersinia ruckeri]|nr:hypothetical protein [Yersinia ruckeri]
MTLPQTPSTLAIVKVHNSIGGLPREESQLNIKTDSAILDAWIKKSSTMQEECASITLTNPETVLKFYHFAVNNYKRREGFQLFFNRDGLNYVTCSIAKDIFELFIKIQLKENMILDFLRKTNNYDVFEYSISFPEA